MCISRALLPIFLVIGFFSLQLEASDSAKPFDNHHCDKGDISRHDNDLGARDWEELYDFVSSKRCLTIDQKGCRLAIAGDIRFDWRHTLEMQDLFDDDDEDNDEDDDAHKVDVRGGEAVDNNNVRISRNDFDVTFNLYLDYTGVRTWGVAWLQFDNTAGIDYNDWGCSGRNRFIPNTPDKPYQNADGVGDDNGYQGSGFCCDICLRKAYFGYNLCKCGDTRFDIEVGRRHFYHVFDSEVQFLSRFDGVLLRYCSRFNCFSDWYLNLGGFVIDERSNHFGWVTEGGLMDICNSGIDLKYSYIDWRKNGSNRCTKRDPRGHKYQVSQWTGHYHFDAEFVSQQGHLYGAFLVNHDAGTFTSNDEIVIVVDEEGQQAFGTQNVKNDKYAFYVGGRIGEVCRCGDWAIDLQYQYVEAQAVPDYDMSGIGRGNWFDETLTKHGRGNTNFKGFRIEGIYAFTDNLVMNARYEESRQITKTIGGEHKYNQFRFEGIYAF